MNPSAEALNDITDYLKKDKRIRQNEQHWYGCDVYVVSRSWIQTKETTLLNKELGLYSINKIGNTNGY